MANGYSDIETQRRTAGHTLHTVVDQAAVEQEVRYFKARVTLLGNEGTNDYHELLGKLPADNVEIVPELCIFRKVTGTMSFSSKLVRVLADSTTTDLSTAAAYTGAAVRVLVAADALLLPVLGKTDGLRLVFTSVTTTNAGAAFDVEIAYRKKR